MYTKGELRVVTPPCEYYQENEACYETPEHFHKVADSRSRPHTTYKGGFCVFLPHSCDEWVIGGVDEAIVLLNDLLEIIVKQAPLSE